MKLHIGRSYTAYSVGVAVAWAVALALASVLAPTAKRNNILLVFGGFVIGWLSATIARYVYPPPKRYLPAAETPPARGQ